MESQKAREIMEAWIDSQGHDPPNALCVCPPFTIHHWIWSFHPNKKERPGCKMLLSTGTTFFLSSISYFLSFPFLFSPSFSLPLLHPPFLFSISSMLFVSLPHQSPNLILSLPLPLSLQSSFFFLYLYFSFIRLSLFQIIYHKYHKHFWQIAKQSQMRSYM